MAVPSNVLEFDPVAGAARLEELFAQVAAPFFGRREPRLRARAYLDGLLSGLERKNGWSEFAGDTPEGMQRLLNHARWDADAVRDALRAQVAERIGSPLGILAVDDTGFEEGPAVCGSTTPVHRHRREDHELSDRGVLLVCEPRPAAGPDRPGAICAGVVVR